MPYMNKATIECPRCGEKHFYLHPGREVDIIPAIFISKPDELWKDGKWINDPSNKKDGVSIARCKCIECGMNFRYELYDDCSYKYFDEDAENDFLLHTYNENSKNLCIQYPSPTSADIQIASEDKQIVNDKDKVIEDLISKVNSLEKEISNLKAKKKSSSKKQVEEK